MTTRRKKTTIDPTLGRNETLEQFYKLHEKEFRSLALRVIPSIDSRSSLLQKEDAQNILDSLHSRFDEYIGPVTEDDFVDWAKQFIHDSAMLIVADRFEFVAEVHQKYKSTMMAGIRSVLNRKRKFSDASQDEKDIYQTLLSHAVLKWADRLRAEGEAKLKRRLYSLAVTHALLHIQKTKRRGELVERVVREAPEVPVRKGKKWEQMPDASQSFHLGERGVVNPVELASMTFSEEEFSQSLEGSSIRD